jgi:hypothetical protein
MNKSWRIRLNRSLQEFDLRPVVRRGKMAFSERPDGNA